LQVIWFSFRAVIIFIQTSKLYDYTMDEFTLFWLSVQSRLCCHFDRVSCKVLSRLLFRLKKFTKSDKRMNIILCRFIYFSHLLYHILEIDSLVDFYTFIWLVLLVQSFNPIGLEMMRFKLKMMRLIEMPLISRWI
jgi:hypothetical protein